MSAPYPDLSTVNATTDVTQILVYANVLTGGILGALIVGAFWVIILLGSFFAQLRFSGRARIDISFASASFSSFGLAVIMSLENGLIQPYVLITTIALSMVGLFWVFFSDPN